MYFIVTVSTGKEAGMDKHEIEQLLKCDFSAGTDSFRDALLQQCLAVLDSSASCASQDNAADSCVDISDADLELLAAAGTIEPKRVFPVDPTHKE